MNTSSTFPFEYPELTVINGEPDYITILNLCKELKANAQSVPSSIGGGHYGYLPLVIPNAEFQALPHTAPVIWPTDPAVFTIEPGTTQVQAMVQKEDYLRSKHNYDTYIQIQLALKNQIIKALDAKYTKPLRNTTTNTITKSLLEIITHLKSRYGRVNLLQKTEAENVLRTYVYDVREPIEEAVFQRVQDFAEIADMAEAPISDKQKVDFAMVIILKSKRFNLDIREWNKKEPQDKSWETFQTYFSTAYDSLRDTDELTIQDSPVLNQAQLAQAILQAMEPQTSNLLITDDHSTVPSAESLTHSTSTNPSNHINAAVTGNETILQKLEALTQDLVDIKTKMQNQRNSRGRRGQRKPKRYCWTHGCCEHWGADCNDKAPGHVDDASFRSRHGGSNKDCRPNT